MPKRGAIALVTTAIALVLLLSFKTPSETRLTGSTGGALGAISQPAPTAAAPVAPAATLTPAGGSSATAAPTATASPGAGATANGTIVGSVIETRYGPVQVQVTIQEGRITDVQALQLPSDHPRSAELSQNAASVLRSEVLAAQGAQVDLVSGATYTSAAYLQSLQAALDAVRT